MILPGAIATISTLPTDAQNSAAQKTAMIVAPIARPIGDAGVSAISSAAGKNASSYSRRRACCLGKSMTFLADVMNAGLHEMEFGIPAVAADQLVMAALLDDSAPLDGDNPVDVADRR